MYKKFYIGQKVKVISQGWEQPKLINRVGIVADRVSYLNYDNFDYTIIFPGWKDGHAGNAEARKFKECNEINCWNLGSRKFDIIELVIEDQLELDFENET